ncbi:MAG: type II toxin-antitoxin system death-on-curing family toxin [Sphingobium sp.]
MPSEILWLTFEDVNRLHDISLEKFGGVIGFKDESAVHSAINAPRNKVHYRREDDVLALGIVLCSRIAGNHGFSDGNKRTALSAMRVFLQLNGFDISTELDAPSDFEDEDGRTWTLLEKAVKDLVAHAIGEDEFYAFLEDHIHETGGCEDDETDDASSVTHPDSRDG